MRLSAIPRPRSLLIPIALAAVALAAFLVATGASGRQPTKKVVKEAENPSLGRTILTTTKGRTLYSLSVETKGRFICTGSCLSIWHPLTVPDGVKPRGPVKLGTVKRPDGRTQVTYKGRPLYRFDGDTKAGQVNGEGIKDVGTWHAASVPKAAAPQPQPEPPPPNPYGY
jgi:predicted lipoprotein with Yx(FWY)xxD motif